MIPFNYEKKINSDTISEKQKATLIAIFKKQLKVIYHLSFNKNESFFQKQKNMDVENRSINFAKTKMGKGVFYFNKISKTMLNHKFYSGEEFLIEIPFFEWKLTQETRKIGDYTCYKATTIKYVEGRNGKMERKVIAWYTTQIPYNFGPKDYNGLPGLILELQEDNLLIKATTISIKPKAKKIIKRPNQGEKITLKAYDDMVKEMYYNRRRRN